MKKYLDNGKRTDYDIVTLSKNFIEPSTKNIRGSKVFTWFPKKY